MDRKDRAIVQILRNDSRSRLADLAEQTAIPISTAHERVQRLLKRRVIRCVSIPNYNALRVPLQCWFIIQSDEREPTIERLKEEPCVNTVLRVSNGADIICECMFTDFSDQHRFMEMISGKGKVLSIPVVEEIAREKMRIKEK